MVYLFWSQAIVWIFLIVYIYSLIRKTSKLEDELKNLESEFYRG